MLKPLLTSDSRGARVRDRSATCPRSTPTKRKVVADPAQLHLNALKFTERGEVRVAARLRPERRRGRASRSRDTGIGIAPERQSRIFEEFSQVDTQLQAQVKGTGLGLPLSRSLAQLLGGELGVESVVGQGSLFTLSIPTTLGDPSRASRPAEGATRKRALLIDDDENSALPMRQIISGESCVTSSSKRMAVMRGSGWRATRSPT